MRSTPRRGSIAWLLAGLALTARAQDQPEVKVEGVNPADLLTQVQFTYEHDAIADEVGQHGLVLKYDRRLGASGFGLNFEFPAYLNLSLPGESASGYGDLFTRARYIATSGKWSYGGAFEVVWPVGSNEFSGHRYQTNPAVLAVYAWSWRNITAFAHKQFIGRIEDGSRGRDIRQWYVRALQIHITPTGWFHQADVAFNRDSENGEEWFDSRLSIGKQLTALARASIEIKKLTGDRENDWAISLSYARKL